MTKILQCASIWVAILTFTQVRTDAGLIVNGGFETGDLTGWQQTAGAGQGHVITVAGSPAFIPDSPYEGQYMFSASDSDGAGNATEITLQQVIDVSAISSIGLGNASLNASGYVVGGTVSPLGNISHDTAEIEVQFFDGLTFLSSVSTGALDPPGGDWRLLSIANAPIPILTDSIVFRFVTRLEPGKTSIDILGDNFDLEIQQVSAVPAPSALALMAIGSLSLCGCRRRVHRREGPNV